MKKYKLKINVGKQIRKFRNICKLSVRELQKQLSTYGYITTEQLIYKWERGLVKPSLDAIILLTKIFNISVSTFFEESLSPTTNVTKEEEKFLTTYRTNKYYRQLIKVLYKKEVQSIC